MSFVGHTSCVQQISFYGKKFRDTWRENGERERIREEKDVQESKMT